MCRWNFKYLSLVRSTWLNAFLACPVKLNSSVTCLLKVLTLFLQPRVVYRRVPGDWAHGDKSCKKPFSISFFQFEHCVRGCKQCLVWCLPFPGAAAGGKKGCWGLPPSSHGCVTLLPQQRTPCTPPSGQDRNQGNPQLHYPCPALSQLFCIDALHYKMLLPPGRDAEPESWKARSSERERGVSWQGWGTSHRAR